MFRLALRQSEGLIGSIMRLLEIDLPVPDHTTLSRRACGLPVCEPPRVGTDELHLIVDNTGLKLRGAGEWLFEKHETAKRRCDALTRVKSVLLRGDRRLPRLSDD